MNHSHNRSLALLALAYFLLQWLVLLLPVIGKYSMAMGLAVGVGLAVLLLSPRRQWVGISLTLFLAGVLAHLLAGQLVFASAGFAGAPIFQALACAWLMVRFCGADIKLNRVREIVFLLLVAIFVSAGASLISAALTSSAQFVDSWLSGWGSGVVGILLITSLIVTWVQLRGTAPGFQPAQALEVGLFLVAWCAIAWLSFTDEYFQGLHLRPYLLAALVIWPALRSDVRLVSLANFSLALIVVMSPAVNAGPSFLGGNNQTERLLLAQAFLAIIGVTGALIAASIAERKTAEQVSLESQARLQALANNLLNDMIYQVVREPDGSMRLVYVSAGVERLNGVSVEAALRDSAVLYDQIVKEDRALVTAAEEASARDMSSFQVEARFRRSDGQMRWLKFFATPRRLADGRILWDGIQTDITDRKRTEVIIQERLRLMQYATSHSLVETLTETLDAAETLSGSAIGFYHFLADDQRTLTLQAWSTHTLKNMCSAEGAGRHYDVAEAGVWVDCIYQRQPVVYNDYNSLAHRKGLPAGHAPLARILVVPVFRDEQIVAIVGVGNKPQDYVASDTELLVLLADLAWDIAERKKSEEALRQSEMRFRTLISQAGDGFELVDAHGRYLDVNDATCRMLGYSRQEMLSLSIADIDARNPLGIFMATFQSLIGKPPSTYETHHRRKDGTEFPVEITVFIILLGEEHLALTLVRDITDRKRAEAALIQANERLALAQHSAGAGMWNWDMLTDEHNWSLEFFHLFGLHPAHAQASFATLRTVIFPEDLPLAEEQLAEAIRNHTPLSSEYRITLPSGDIRWIQTLGNTIYAENGEPLHVSGICIDISARKQAQAQIEQALAEKEILLRELYHRTKNNMGVISALLNLQSAYFDDEHLKAAFADTQNRIQAMSLVHQKLYETQDLSHLNLKEYLCDLAHLLVAGYQLAPGKLALVLEMEDVQVLMDTATPCGLILNELVSNALKYAFPNERVGELKIQLSKIEPGKIRLRVADNGVGAPAGFDARTDGKLGLQTIFALAQSQLGGQVTFDFSQGVACQVDFQSDLHQARV